jgi:type IV pilus assembly protein PilB
VVSVLAQRLLRRVCSACAQPYRPSPLEMQRAGMHAEDLRVSRFQQGAGCEACHYTGYKGRVSVFELLVLDEKVKDAILNHKASYDIRRISIESSGLITLLEDGLDKASRGQTTISEVLRVLPRLDKPRPLAEIRRLCRSPDV